MDYLSDVNPMLLKTRVYNTQLNGHSSNTVDSTIPKSVTQIPKLNIFLPNMYIS
jgi:hypothetical protein